MDEEQQPKSIEEEIKNDVKAILKILNGNGKTGLCAKVDLLWTGSLFVVGAIVLILLKEFV